MTVPTDYRVEEQMEIDRQRLEEHEECRRLLGEDSDSEETDTEVEENQQPPLTFPGARTLVQGDAPVLPTHLGSAAVIPHLPQGRRLCQKRQMLLPKRVPSLVMPEAMSRRGCWLPGQR